MFHRLFFLLNDHLAAKSIFRILPIAALLLAVLNIDSQTPPEKPAPDAITLELNQTIERKIAGESETHNFQIQINKAQSAKILIEQTEADVSASVYGADNKLLMNYDNESRLKETENVEFVAEETGNYRIEIKTGSRVWAGIYKIRLNEIREANERDRAVYEVQKLIARAENSKRDEKYDEAVSNYRLALEVAEKQLASPTLLTSRILNGLIGTNLDKGDYPAAFILLERAAAAAETSGANQPQNAFTTFLRGQYYRSVGDRANADRNFRQSLTIYENALGREHPLLFDPLLKLSGLYISLDDLDGAVVYLKRAEKIVEKHYGADHKMMAGVVNNLGVVYMSKNENAAAEQYFLRVMEIGEKANESRQYRYSLTLQNLGVIAYRKKDFRRALEFYERTLKMREEILGGEHPQVGWALYGISAVYDALNNPAKALETLGRAREIAEKSVGSYNSLTTSSILRSAKILAAQGETERAVAAQKLHDERYEKFFTSELTIGSERQKLISTEKLQQLTSATISLHLTAARNNQTALDTAALTVIKRKGRVLDAVAENLTAIRRRAGETDRALIDRLNAVNSQVAKLALNKPAKMPPAEHERQLADLERQKEEIEVAIGDRNALFGAQTPPVTLDGVKAEIPPDGALVEFAVYLPLDFKKHNDDEAYGEPRYIAYVLRKNGDVKFAELGDKKVIDKAIDDLRKTLRDPQRKDVKQFARTADEKIMKPVRALLGEAKQIFIAPDGDLNLIPFEALVDEKGQYLIKNYSFDYLSSGRDLLRMKTTRTSSRESVIIANPLFGGTMSGKSNLTPPRNFSDTYFAPLAATMGEADAIRAFFPEAAIYAEARATETALKEVAAPRILHIATHGFFLETGGHLNAADADARSRSAKTNAEMENPLLRSGIALAGANRRDGKPGEDGILTALEASGLNLWGTKLVVLSACDTGLGEVKNGEGVYGLRRAFVLAGTESLVMSLWSVSDYGTRQIMTSYYKNLKAGMGRGASLRQTQLEMLEKKGRGHPFYWAAFIQSGEWANLEGNR